MAELSPFPPTPQNKHVPVPSSSRAGAALPVLCSLLAPVPPRPWSSLGNWGVTAGAHAGSTGTAQSSLAKPPMVTLRSCLLATSSWRCRAPPPMKQKAGQTGPEQSTPHSQSSRKETAS